MQPYPGMFYIKGFLKRHGYEDICTLDLNLHLFHDIFNNHSRTIVALEERIQETSRETDPLYDTRVRALAGAKRIEGELRHAVDYFCSNVIEGINYEESKRYSNILSVAIQAFHALHDDIVERQSLYSSGFLVNYVEDDLFRYKGFYEAQFRDISNKYSPDFVGISVIFDEQLLHAFATARWAKKYFPKAQICLGGPVPTRLLQWKGDEEHTRRNIFRHVDSVVLYEAEHSILELLSYTKGSAEELPEYINIAFEKETRLAKKLSPHRDLYLPDYDDLEYDRYFNTTFKNGRLKVLNFLASRGCYWRRCSFCTSYQIYSDHCACPHLDLLVDLIKKYQQIYGFKTIRFNDEATPPKLLRQLSNAIIDGGLVLNWETNVRVEKGFDDDELCSILSKAGCRRLLIGIESGSQRILDRMNKGYKVPLAESMLKRLSKWGIQSHIYIICFYPGETVSDLEKTYEFLLRNREYFDSVYTAVFTGEVLAPIFNDLPEDQYILPHSRYDLDTSFRMKKKPTKRMDEVYRKIYALQDEITYPSE